LHETKKRTVRKFEIDRKIDPLALTALLLSLLAAGSQLKDYLRGPDLRLITPHRVALYADKGPNGAMIVHIAAPMAYANVAQAPYGDLVLEETASLTVGGKTSRQEWNAFGKLTSEGLKATEPALLQPVPGQDALSHVTLFTPITTPDARDNLSPEELFARSTGARKMVFQFGIKPYKGNEIHKACSVALTDDVRTKLFVLTKSNFYALCREEG